VSSRLTDPVTALMRTLRSPLVQVRRYDPESKGIAERADRLTSSIEIELRCWRCHRSHRWSTRCIQCG
jgi:hypothetical protein